jgi:hypothetical protein
MNIQENYHKHTSGVNENMEERCAAAGSISGKLALASKTLACAEIALPSMQVRNFI